MPYFANSVNCLQRQTSDPSSESWCHVITYYLYVLRFTGACHIYFDAFHTIRKFPGGLTNFVTRYIVNETLVTWTVLTKWLNSTGILTKWRYTWEIIRSRKMYRKMTSPYYACDATPVMLGMHTIWRTLTFPMSGFDFYSSETDSCELIFDPHIYKVWLRFFSVAFRTAEAFIRLCGNNQSKLTGKLHPSVLWPVREYR